MELSSRTNSIDLIPRINKGIWNCNVTGSCYKLIRQRDICSCVCDIIYKFALGKVCLWSILTINYNCLKSLRNRNEWAILRSCMEWFSFDDCRSSQCASWNRKCLNFVVFYVSLAGDRWVSPRENYHLAGDFPHFFVQMVSWCLNFRVRSSNWIVLINSISSCCKAEIASKDWGCPGWNSIDLVTGSGGKMINIWVDFDSIA